MNWRIGELLVRKKLITWEQLEEVLREQTLSGELTGEILIRKGYIPPFLFYKVLAEKHLMQFVEIKRTYVNPKAVDAIPRSLAEKYSFIPLEINEDTLVVGVGNPLNILPESEIKKFVTVEHICSVLCMPSDIQQAIKDYYGNKRPVLRGED